MFRKCKSTERGSTLIEILVVTFILGISVTAMVSLITMSMARNRLAKERAVATRLAQEGIEWVRAERDRLGFSGLNAVTRSTYCLDSFPGTEDVGGGIEDVSQGSCGADRIVPGVEPDYTREMNVLEREPDRVVFEVVVTWQGNEVKLPGEVHEWSLD